MKPFNVRTSDWLQYNTLFFLEHFMGHDLYQKLFGAVEQKLFNSIEQFAAKQKPDNAVHVVEYTGGQWPETLHHPYEVRVFRGAAKDWACTTKWSFDYFADNFGDKEVTIITNTGLIERDEKQDWETLSLRDYIKQLRGGSKKYLKFSSMITEESMLWKDFNSAWLRKFMLSETRNHFLMFMGAKGTMTPIHDGLPPTVFVQIRGEKKWVFYPTCERLFIGVRPERTNYFFSQAGVNDKTNPKYPLMKLANPVEVVIGPGDVLWFPAFVWHQVENLSDSIGVAYKFSHLPSALKSSKMLTTLFFLSTKPWFVKSAYMTWKTKQIYMFSKPTV
jgi:hypothetical protein